MREKSTVFEPLLEFDESETGEGVKAVWLLTRTACHYFFIPILHGIWSHFFIHSVKYIQAVLCLYIYTRFFIFVSFY